MSAYEGNPQDESVVSENQPHSLHNQIEAAQFNNERDAMNEVFCRLLWIPLLTTYRGGAWMGRR